jgi:hypothetical protein
MRMAVERVEYSAAAWSLQGGRNIRTPTRASIVPMQDDGLWRVVLDLRNSDGVTSAENL